MSYWVKKHVCGWLCLYKKMNGFIDGWMDGWMNKLSNNCKITCAVLLVLTSKLIKFIEHIKDVPEEIQMRSSFP